MNDTIMAEEMQSTPKAAFVNKPYTQEERVKRDEDELEQLMKEREGSTAEETEEVEAEPTNAEEKTFKKRYSDLRRHQQKQAEEFKTELAALKSQLESATKKEMKLPKSDEDIEQWASDYPLMKFVTVMTSTSGQKNNLSGYRTHCTKMIMMHVPQQEQLTYIKQIEASARVLRARMIKVQRKLLLRKIKGVSRKAMKRLLTLESLK